MDSRHLQAWWAHRQGLLNISPSVPAADVLRQTGWARSVGGAHPYIGLFTRAGLSREAIDADAAAVLISELPSARACTYVVPAEDFDLALALARATGIGEVGTAAKLGVPSSEIETLAEAVLETLKDGPKDPAGMRAELGDKVRNLGEEGKKRGLTTTLPVALGVLQQEGKILRRPATGRFDTQKYAYMRWDKPMQRLSTDEAYLRFAHLYFDWIGPATPANFCWITGLGVKAGKAVLDQLDLVPVEAGSPYLIKKEHLDDFHAFKVPSEPVYALIGALDGHLLHRREVASMVDPDHLKIKMPSGKGVVEVGSVQDLSSNAIVDRGRVVGLWEYDPDVKELVYATFEPLADSVKPKIVAMRDWAETQMGDVRSFSLDSPASRKPYLDSLRAGLAKG